MTTNGLLFPKPPQHTLSVAAHHARWRFVEREGSEPAVIVLNPCHQAELQPPFVGDRQTLAGLLVKFDAMIRPGHLLVLATDPDDASDEVARRGQYPEGYEEELAAVGGGQQNSRHTPPVPATTDSSPQPKGVNQ